MSNQSQFTVVSFWKVNNELNGVHGPFDDEETAEEWAGTFVESCSGIRCAIEEIQPPD